MDPSALVLLPEPEARALLRERPIVWRLLRPPYPALGEGVLRALRVSEREGITELTVGYERYARLEHDMPAGGS
ncbi:MAG: hypothetical protein GIX03_02645 [Candidatus Eremiobacteraeota bacterium]|nr:hypothetical protein [Candidatus Eremiobacteraeota bacterium]MBC5801915.1 hypothetical protein [Candidatus Eremiobacteraeota bacterium]MBC5821748.1 hypothetical protein [Candidatus Eremiobacteraeota bacterium]